MTVPAFHGNIGFNAHHAPMGAFFSFTVGHFGTRGGLGLQLGRPANQDVFIGVKEGARDGKGVVRCLPFFEGAKMREAAGAEANFMPEAAGAADSEIACYSAAEMRRRYGWGTDTWETAEFAFRVYSPFEGIPDPARADNAVMRAALLPAVVAELRVDNRAGKQMKTAFFAVNFNETGARLIDEGLPAGRVGFALRGHLGVAGEAFEEDGAAALTPFHFMRWNVQEGLAEKTPHLLGLTPGIGVEVPAGKCVTLRLGIGCYLGGVVTTRLEGRYFYTRYFSDLNDVLNTALERYGAIRAGSEALDARLSGDGRVLADDATAMPSPVLDGGNLNADQRFLIAHATRSYYGATQLLDVAGQPYWIVNEGEYCMMNTLDLSIDHMFWELEINPWVVRNLLDNFVRYYSYHDQVKDPATGELHPGGIAFCHDQGVHNQFSRFGASSYELPDLTGCFSYMTQEEVCNWILLAATYLAVTKDAGWAQLNAHVIRACFESMVARDHPVAEKRAGITQLDSSRCGAGQEITSYDSLDASLAQTRNNLYIAVKCWAAYLGIAQLLAAMGEVAAASPAAEAADRAGQTIAKQLRQEGWIPALFEADNPGHASRILPAIEALIYPLHWFGVSDALEPRGRHGDLLAALRRHVATLLSDGERRNHFADGGIRLSSTSDNSWASKIAIAEHVARVLFNLDENGVARTLARGATGWEKSDAAHTRWQTEGASAYWACSDQIINGVAKGSKYYPRIITAALWLRES